LEAANFLGDFSMDFICCSPIFIVWWRLRVPWSNRSTSTHQLDAVVALSWLRHHCFRVALALGQPYPLIGAAIGSILASSARVPVHDRAAQQH